jgi:hypothetical protein
MAAEARKKEPEEGGWIGRAAASARGGLTVRAGRLGDRHDTSSLYTRRVFEVHVIISE